MDFAREHTREASLASRSNLCLVSVAAKEQDGNDHDRDPTCPHNIDQLLLEASNETVRDVLTAGRDVKDDPLVDAALYDERLLPRQETIQQGDLVVIMESFDRLTFVYVDEGKIYDNRNGHFYHKDFIGKPFGSKIRSRNNRGYGFCYLLKPTPELWARSLDHRTQIVYELDQSQIIFQLWLRPNMIVVESGTGSGAMSHALMRTIAPHGHLHTYEFNQQRAETARQEFKRNGVGHLVTVHHRDVCAKDCHGAGGFDLPAQSAHAVFLDLPEPWEAIPHAAYVLRPSGRIATYSPCVEQTQRTIQAMEKCGFHSIRTMEYRLQEHYVDQAHLPAPPSIKRPKYESATDPRVENGEEPTMETETAKQTTTTPAGSTDAKENSPANGEHSTDGAGSDTNANHRKRSYLVARPYGTMRGHTAFLTFATAPTSRNTPEIKYETDSEH